MIFRLLEDYATDAINEAISILKTTSEAVQSALVDNYDAEGNPVYDVAKIKASSGYKSFNWTAAAEMATPEDKEKLAMAYTDILSISNEPLYRRIHDNAADIWLHILVQLGFSNKTNPFLRYVESYPHFNDNFMRQQLISLNNLYGKGVFDAPDLERKNTSLLYNPALWELPAAEAEAAITHYYYLKKHAKSYDPSVSKKYQTIKDRIDAHPDKLPEDVIFKDGTDPVNCKQFEPKLTVDDFIKIYFNGGSTPIQTIKSTTKKSNLNTNQKTLIDDAIKNGSFKYGDVADIVAYFSELHDAGKI